jgi:hypothetical protein
MGRDKRETENSTFRKPRTSTNIGNTADWGSIDAQKLVKLVETASRKGGAVRLGYTRDGGAYAVGVYAGSNYFTDFIRPSEDIDQYLTDLTVSFEDFDGSNETVPETARTGRSK